MMLTLCTAIGLTLYIYAEIICKGAVLAHIDKKKLCIGSLIFMAWQQAMLMMGAFAAICIENFRNTEEMQEFTWLCSIFIFAVLAGQMVRKAWKNEPVEERREDIFTGKKIVLFSARIGARTGLIGLVTGFLGADLLMGIMVMAMAAITVFIFGIYSGYRFGYIYKTTAYISGALCFIFTDIYLIGCYFVGI